MNSTTSPSLCSQTREFLRNLVEMMLKIFTVIKPMFQQDGKMPATEAKQESVESKSQSISDSVAQNSVWILL
jgi:hypothetical protein